MILCCINVPTPNARRFADFYRNALGAQIDDSHGGPDRIEISFDAPCSFWIVATQDNSYQRSETTFEFSVSDVDAEYERLLALGIEIAEPPKDLPWGYRYIHIKDPDENGIDLVQAL